MLTLRNFIAELSGRLRESWQGQFDSKLLKDQDRDYIVYLWLKSGKFEHPGEDVIPGELFDQDEADVMLDVLYGTVRGNALFGTSPVSQFEKAYRRRITDHYAKSDTFLTDFKDVVDSIHGDFIDY